MHPLIKLVYLTRMLGYILISIIMISIFYKEKGSLFWFLIIAQCYLWPQITYLHDRFSKSVKRAELLNMYFEYFLCGIWLSTFSFSLFPSTAIFCGCIFNLIQFEGPQKLVRALPLLIIGLLAAIYFQGFHFKPESSLLTSSICIIFIVLYALMVSYTSYGFARNLNVSRKKIKEAYEEIAAARDELVSEIVLAKKFQEQLIPSTNPTNFISSFYKPMDLVGGDFFDFIELDDDDTIGIFLSDVSGHGVSAAFITSMIKTTILQAGARKNNPSELLLYINEILQNHIADRFITAFYGIYNKKSRTVTYSNAGHPQPYLINQSGITQLQGGKKTAIAMFPNNALAKTSHSFINYTEEIPSGSKLLMYTDGLTEARSSSDHGLFEYAGMFDVFREYAAGSSEEFIAGLHNALVQFRRSDSFDDDICLICLEVA